MEFENQYLTHDEYKELGGKLIEMPFNLLEYKVEKKIDEMTFNRFKKLKEEEYPQELKLCVYDLINIFEDEGNSSISSESIGNYSVIKKSINDMNKIKENIIKEYLSEVKVNDVYVLYCGVDLNEN